MRAHAAHLRGDTVWDRRDMTQYGPPWDTRPPPGLGGHAERMWLKMQSKLRVEAEVEETFIGEDQRDKQNVFSKSQSEDAYKSRRVGQLKQ